MEKMIEDFLLMNYRHGECPNRFVISALQHRSPPVQATVIKRPGEGDDELFHRVLSSAKLVAGRTDPHNPMSIGGGTIECFYDAKLLCEEQYELIDGRANVLAMMRHWAHSPSQPWECREYALEFLRLQQRPPEARLQ
jgi:hypothetical protein